MNGTLEKESSRLQEGKAAFFFSIKQEPARTACDLAQTAYAPAQMAYKPAQMACDLTRTAYAPAQTDHKLNLSNMFSKWIWLYFFFSRASSLPGLLLKFMLTLMIL